MIDEKVAEGENFVGSGKYAEAISALDSSNTACQQGIELSQVFLSMYIIVYIK